MASHGEAQDLRVFIREMTLRIERVAAEMRADRGVIVAQIEDHRAESRRYFEVLDAKLQDQLEESRTQRRALFHILDRLDNGGAAPAG